MNIEQVGGRKAHDPTRPNPQKSLSKNPIIGFSPLPTARPCPLTHDPPLLILAGYRLVVPGSCACFTFFACYLCICRDLEIGLYILPCTFGFLWRGLFSNLPFFMTCFFWGLGLVGSWAFLPPAYSIFILWPCQHFLPYHSAIPTVMLFDSILLDLFGPAVCFPPNDSVCSLGLFLHCLWAHVPFPFWASLAHLLSLSFLGPFPILLSHELLLTLLDFLGSITLYLILGANGSSISPLLSLLALLLVCLD